MCESRRTLLPDAKDPKAMLPGTKIPRHAAGGRKKTGGFPGAHKDQYTTNAGFYKVIDKKMTSMTWEAWYKWVR